MALRLDSVPRAFGVLAALVVVGTAGCGRQSADQAVDEALQNAGQSRANVFPLAGKVTTDGHAPEPGKLSRRIIVMLNDRAKPDAPISGVPKAMCNPNGEFAFNMYGQGDGVPPGKYVVTIVDLRHDKRKGYIGPDGLKNLYNDPEKNATIPEFIIDHQPPGKKDYAFDLKIEGREAATPGPKAVTAFH
jgi:hypothetical protein